MRKNSKLTADEAFLLHNVRNSLLENLNSGSVGLVEIFDDTKPIHTNSKIRGSLRDYITEILKNYAHTYESLTSQDLGSQRMFWYNVTEYIHEDGYMEAVANMTYEDFLYQWNCDNKS